MLRTFSATVACLLVMMIAVPSQAKLGNPERTAADNFVLAERIFNNSSAELKEIKLKQWGQISNKGQTLPELETKYLVLVKRLGLDPAKETSQIDRDGLVSLSQVEVLADAAIQVFMQTVPEQIGPGTIHWGVAIQTTDPEQARKFYYLLKMALRELNCPEEPRLEFLGSIPTRLAPEQRFLALKKLADSVGAETVEGAGDSRLTSLSFYTNEGSDWLTVAGQRINLNLAMREVPSLNQTNLYIGIPLLFSDY